MIYSVNNQVVSTSVVENEEDVVPFSRNKYMVCTLFQGGAACFCCGLKTWLDVSGLCACFLGYYAMDSDCSLRGMPLAE